jgi:hypothetical protein
MGPLDLVELVCINDHFVLHHGTAVRLFHLPLGTRDLVLIPLAR